LAPKSVYTPPASWVTSDNPFNVITGAVVSVTSTVRTTVNASFPELSE